jgi:2-polyprenyl-3-methyl-5-hydroxy-6-metoxy-1,4-benzoquinol methylase
MNLLSLNKRSWDIIGIKAATNYINKGKFSLVFNDFCKSLPKNAKVLDLGCGPGIPVTKELVDRGFVVTGVDISPEMIRLAEENVPKASYNNISMTKIRYEKDFDGIVACYSMLCLDPSKFTIVSNKIYKALRPGGSFFIALNEPKQKYSEKDYYTKIAGQLVYSKPYSEDEIKKAFPDMEVSRVERETIHSEMYGTEHCLIMLLKKK